MTSPCPYIFEMYLSKGIISSNCSSHWQVEKRQKDHFPTTFQISMKAKFRKETGFINVILVNCLEKLKVSN